MRPAARILSDQVLTGHGCTVFVPILGGSNATVFIAGLPAALMGDPLMPHTIFTGDKCIPHPAMVNSGSTTVFIAGRPAARMGDSADFGTIISGAPNVFIGG